MEWLNYHHLFYFWLVCKEGGFSKAAEKLRIAQSAVSLQISKLEDHLGEKLMERGPRGFTLTEAGQVALAQSEEIFKHGQDLLQYFRSGQMKSQFRIGTVGGLSKNLQLKILNQVISNSEIELSIEVGDLSALIELLIGYQLDAILSDSILPNSIAEALVQSEVAIEPMCLVSRIKTKSAKGTTDLSRQLRNGLYLPAKSSPITSAILETISLNVQKPQIRGYIADIALLRLLALQTDAVVAIPKIGVQRELSSKQLFIVHEFKKIKQSYFLIYRQKGKRHPMINHLFAR